MTLAQVRMEWMEADSSTINPNISLAQFHLSMALGASQDSSHPGIVINVGHIAGQNRSS